MDSINQKFSEDSLLTLMNICSESSFEEWKQVVIDKKVSGINLFNDNFKIQILDEKYIEYKHNYAAELALYKDEIIDLIPSKRNELIEEDNRKKQVDKV